MQFTYRIPILAINLYILKTVENTMMPLMYKLCYCYGTLYLLLLYRFT